MQWSNALGRLLDSYLQLAIERGDLVNLLLSDLQNVPEEARRRARQSQHDYLTEWSELLQAIHPGLDATAARIQVQAALMIINNGAQTPHLTRLPTFRPAIRAVAASLLY